VSFMWSLAFGKKSYSIFLQTSTREMYLEYRI
jgi:hypothetical protein